MIPRAETDKDRGLRLKSLRVTTPGVTVNYIAMYMGVSIDSVYSLERGKTKVTADKISLYRRACGHFKSQEIKRKRHHSKD